MSKFIVIKKNNIFIIFIILILILTFTYSTVSYAFKSYTTLSSTSNTLSTKGKYDLDGDGLIDDITFSANNISYLIKIKTASAEYLLESKKYGESFIDISTSYNIKLQFYDLSRDGIPEIIISGMKNNIPTTYIFEWDNSNFIEVFSTENNILGVLNSNNSRFPQVLYTQSSKGDKGTESFVNINNKIKNTTSSNTKIPGIDTIQKFIDLIQLTYEIDDAPDIFTHNINSEELGLLWNLDKETYGYSFQSGYFSDIDWNTKASVTSMFWTLSFEKNNIVDSSKLKEELKLYLIVNIDESGTFKISSIRK